MVYSIQYSQAEEAAGTKVRKHEKNKTKTNQDIWKKFRKYGV